MDTIVKTIRKEQLDTEEGRAVISEAGALLKAGELTAFPTETVYGLGADALRADAAEKIYEAKGRPSDNPLIVHIAEFSSLEQIADPVPEAAKLLADAFWPGPLTMILKKRPSVPDRTTGGLDTVAVRMPQHQTALALIRAAGGFVAAPSANTSGRPSPTTAAHVFEDLNGKIPLILDGGAVGIGIESTIIDLSAEEPVILRPGFITRGMLQAVIGTVGIDPASENGNSPLRPKAPGMKYKHYAPKAEMILVNGSAEAVRRKIRSLAQEACAGGAMVGILAGSESADAYDFPGGGVRVKTVGSRSDEAAIARNLYAALRAFDELEVNVIYSECFDTPQLGRAIMNRLMKAAGHQVIDAEDAGS